MVKPIRTLEALKKVGKSNEAGVLQAKANVMRLEASLLSIRKSISETENALSAILAMPSHSIGRSNLAEAAFPDTVSIGVPLQLLSNRPAHCSHRKISERICRARTTSTNLNTAP